MHKLISIPPILNQDFASVATLRQAMKRNDFDDPVEFFLSIASWESTDPLLKGMPFITVTGPPVVRAPNNHTSSKLTIAITEDLQYEKPATIQIFQTINDQLFRCVSMERRNTSNIELSDLSTSAQGLTGNILVEIAMQTASFFNFSKMTLQDGARYRGSDIPVSLIRVAHGRPPYYVSMGFKATDKSTEVFHEQALLDLQKYKSPINPELTILEDIRHYYAEYRKTGDPEPLETLLRSRGVFGLMLGFQVAYDYEI